MAIGAVLASSAFGCGATTGDDAEDARPRRLDVAELSLGFADAPPRAAAWQTVQLPDAWALRRRLNYTAGWYRLRFDVERAPERPWTLVVPPPAASIDVVLNGALLTPSRAEPRLASGREILGPIVLGIQPRPGENELFVRLVADPGAIGMLSPLFVGPTDALAARVARLQLMGWVPRLIGLLAFASAGLLAVVWKRAPHPSDASFMATLVVWGIGSLSPPSVYTWVQPVALGLGAAIAVSGVRRFLRRGPAWVEWAAPAAVLFFAAFLAFVPRLYWPFFTVLSGSAGGIAVVYIAVILARGARRGEFGRGWLVAVPAGLSLTIAAPELIGIAAGSPIIDFSTTAYINAPIILFGVLMLVLRLLDALTDANSLNVELDRRVAERTTELEASYARLSELERERALEAERERILRDLHDGMGSQLVTALAMVDRGRFTPPQIREALQHALDDLRLMVESLDPLERDLLVALGAMRARFQTRFEETGIELAWHLSTADEFPRLDVSHTLNAMRIVQEAITNALRHGEATRIEVSAGEEKVDGRAGVFVEIVDDGRGLGDAPAGRGRTHMQRRAEELAADLRIESAAVGTRVRLWIPVPPQSSTLTMPSDSAS